MAPDFWGRGPGFESGVFHNDPDAGSLCNNVKTQGRGGNKPPPEAKNRSLKKVSSALSHNLQGNICSAFF